MPHTHHTPSDLEDIWHQVPPDYYQEGIAHNPLQRMWHTGKLQAVIELIRDISPKRILDVGSASGWFLSELAKQYPDSAGEGVDVYEPAIAYAKKHYPRISFRKADAHKLPFKDESFDLVICTEVLEHVINPQGVIAEIKRVLKKDGIAIIEMDSGNLLFQIIWYWWTNMRRGVWRDAHIHAFNAKKLEDMLHTSGLSIISKKTFNYSMAVAFLLKKGS